MNVADHGRVAWADAARGLGIVLVVIGHQWRGMNEANLIDNAGLFAAIDSAIYFFHMPLFFFISGLFFQRGVIRDGLWRSFWKRCETLLYPLVIWSWIMAAFLIVAGSLTNRGPISLIDALLYPFPPKDLFWFLWALFVIQTMVSFSVRTTMTLASVALALSAVFALYLLFRLAPGLFNLAFIHAPYFLVGVILTRLGLHLRAYRPWQGIVSLGVLAACIAWAATHPSQIFTPLGYVGSFIAALAFSSAVASFARTLPRVAIVLSALGTASIAIYVMHVIPSAASRIALLKAGISSPVLHLAIGTAAGIFVPLVAYMILKKLGMLRVFGLGRDLPKADIYDPATLRDAPVENAP